MDTTTAPLMAKEIGVSLATAHAWLDEAEVPRAGKGVPRIVPKAAVAKAIREHGAVPVRVRGLTRTQSLLIAALARSPRGLPSARSAARLISASPTVVARDLKTLEERGIIQHLARNAVRNGCVVEQSYITISSSAPMDIVRAARKVTLPNTPPIAPGSAVVPKRFAHHFWNVDSAQLRDASGSFVAGRLLAGDDVGAWAWALSALSPDDIKTAMSRRGVPDRVKAPAEAWERNAVR